MDGSDNSDDSGIQMDINIKSIVKSLVSTVKLIKNVTTIWKIERIAIVIK